MDDRPSSRQRGDRRYERIDRPSSRGPSVEVHSSSRGGDGRESRDRDRDRDSRRGEDGGGSSKHRSDHHHHNHHHHSHNHSRGRSAGRHERGSSAAGASASGGAALPPPPPLLPRSGSGRGQIGTPPLKERGPADRETPGSASHEHGGTPGPSAPVPSNSFLAEVMKHSKQIYGGKGGERQERGGSAEDAEAMGEDGDREAGEIEEHHQEPPARKRKHSPIIWELGPPKQSRTVEGLDAGGGSGGGGGERRWGREDREGKEGGRGRGRDRDREGREADLYERAAQEAAEFQRRQAEEEEGFDPEAPPAMKPSPSGSEGDSPAHRGAGNGQDSHAEDDEGAAEPSTRGIASRWLMDADNEGDDNDDEGGDGSRRRRRGGAGVDEPPSTSSPTVSAELQHKKRGAMEGVGPGGALPTSEAGDYELDSDEGSPSHQRSMQYDMRRECRSVDEFEKVDRISEGTYGVVYRAREKATGRIVALKRVKMEKERDGFPVTSVREISILLNFHHANIVNVEEVVISPKNPDHIFMVMEYMDHDLKSLMDDKQQFSRPFSVAESKCLMQQLLAGVSFLHQHWVLHRDIKTSNILYNSKGDLKLCDFGMARQYGDPLVPYTHLVVTLWYRAPELLLGQELYSTAVDVWSCGCIMAEILTGKPLLMGHGELDQLDKMVQVLGTPTEAEWPGIKKLPNYQKIVLKQMPSQLRQRFTSGASFGGGTATLTEAGFDLLSRLLAWDPEQRITTDEALQHRWFSEPPLPQKKELMPMFAPRKAG